MNEFLFNKSIKLNFKDIVLTHNKSIVNSRSECNISTYFGDQLKAVPVVCSNMKSILTPDICRIFDKRNWFYVYHRIDGKSDVEKFVIKANNEKWNTISISIGIGNEWEALLGDLYDLSCRIDAITIDVALSYTDNILPIIKSIKKYYPKAFLIVGNGSTPEWIKWLEDLGVDCCKLNIGVSKSCRTAQYTGFRSTTVSSLLECVEVAKNIKIMSDGGLTVDENGEVWIGDVNKSFCLGADFLMSGALFSKCIDSPAILNGYFGNASEVAKNGKKHVEGAKIQVETNGLTINEMCDRIEDSIKSGISYSGGNDLSAFNNVKWEIIK